MRSWGLSAAEQEEVWARWRRGESLRLLPSWGGRFGVDLAGEVLLPGPDAQIAPTSFETWLAAQAQPADTSRSSTGSTDSGPG